MSTKKEIVYYKGLNGLRAIAALCVIAAHSWDAMGKIVPQFNAAPISMGNLAVTIFFTLSGFLITSLLFLEQQEKGRVDIKDFYKRRILRIWPLYYFYIILCIVVLLLMHHADLLQSSLLYYLFFAANIPYMFNRGLEGINHLWSISVEEQFYLFWPLFFRKKGNITRRLILFLFAFFLLKFIAWILFKYFDLSILQTALRVIRFDCMAIGGIAALLFHRMHPIRQILISKFSQVLAVFVLILMMVFEVHISSLIDNIIVATCTVVLILSNIIHAHPLINLENKILNFFAKISYGLYVYHVLLILVAEKYTYLLTDNSFNQSLIILFASFVGSTFIAYLSYNYLEKPLLKYKGKFAHVKSSPDPL